MWLECPKTHIPARKGKRGRCPTKRRVLPGEPSPIQVHQLAEQLLPTEGKLVYVRDLVEMSHSRYWMERAIQDSKGEAGLDEYQLRGWRGWHHHMTLTFLAMLFLLQLQLEWKPKASLLTLNDVREILEVILPKRRIDKHEILRWIESKHQARLSARLSHHRRQKQKRTGQLRI